jgi:hypothetical protein
MNWKSLVAVLLALASPALAKRGIVIPAEFAGWVSAVFVAVSGIVSSGVRVGFRDLPTTLAGVVGAAAVLLGSLGLDIPAEVQTALVGIILTVIAWLSRSPKAVTQG